MACSPTRHACLGASGHTVNSITTSKGIRPVVRSPTNTHAWCGANPRSPQLVDQPQTSRPYLACTVATLARATHSAARSRSIALCRLSRKKTPTRCCVPYRTPVRCMDHAHRHGRGRHRRGQSGRAVRVRWRPGEVTETVTGGCCVAWGCEEPPLRGGACARSCPCYCVRSGWAPRCMGVVLEWDTRGYMSGRDVPALPGCPRAED